MPHVALPPHWLHPAPLKPGDKVLVISPAGPVLPEHLEGGLSTLKAWGLEPILHPDLHMRLAAPRGYLAGNDPTRLAALEEGLYSPKYQAVWCSRGGYGTMRLLEHLDPTRARQHPKLLIGFSDITALHLWMTHVAGIASLHAPVVKSLPKHPPKSLTYEHLRDAIFGLRNHTSLLLKDLQEVFPGEATGRLIGGNLSLVAALVGTPYCPSLRGSVLFLEEVTEPDYRLDRLMTTLRLSDQMPAALLLGDFTKCEGVYATTSQLPALLHTLAKEFQIPVAANLPVGHDTRNVPMPHGEVVTLNASKGTMQIHHDTTSPLETLG